MTYYTSTVYFDEPIFRHKTHSARMAVLKVSKVLVPPLLFDRSPHTAVPAAPASPHSLSASISLVAVAASGPGWPQPAHYGRVTHSSLFISGIYLKVFFNDRTRGAFRVVSRVAAVLDRFQIIRMKCITR